jgi:hypothetical protein
MSTRQEVGVINVKYHCHKATRTLSPKSPAWLTQLSYPVDSKLYPDLCIARDSFMILMLRSFQFSALSRGNQRPNLPYKKAWRDTFWGDSVHISCYQKLCHSATGIFATVHRHFSNNNLYCTSRTSCNITSSANKSRKYLHVIVSCRGLKFQFSRVPTHSKAFLSVNVLRILRCQPTITFGIQQYLDLYVACSTYTMIGNIQTCTDSFEPPARLSGLEEEWVGSLMSFGRRQRWHHPCLTIKVNLL